MTSPHTPGEQTTGEHTPGEHTPGAQTPPSPASPSQAAACRRWGSSANCPRAAAQHRTATTLGCLLAALASTLFSVPAVALTLADQPAMLRISVVAGVCALAAGVLGPPLHTYLRHQVHRQCCTTGDTPAPRWRLVRIEATDDPSHHVAVVYTAQTRHQRVYHFVHEPITIGGRPAFGWDAGDWADATVYDSGSYSAVFAAVRAFHQARQLQLRLNAECTHSGGDTRWRLAQVRVIDDVIAVLSNADGCTRDYRFARQAATIGGHVMLGWDAPWWGHDTQSDHAGFTAVMDAVTAFHTAYQRDMTLREPPRSETTTDGKPL